MVNAPGTQTLCYLGTSYIPITDKPEEIFDIRIDVLYLPIANTDNGQDTEINIQPATENKKGCIYG